MNPKKAEWKMKYKLKNGWQITSQNTIEQVISELRNLLRHL
jgi:hypothetical protein